MKPRRVTQLSQPDWLEIRSLVDLEAEEVSEKGELSSDEEVQVSPENIWKTRLCMVIWTVLGFCHLR